MNNNIYDVAIIGSGPAGLTSAIYTSRANLKTILFAGDKWGGQLMLTSEVENYPGFPDGIMGPKLMDNMKQQAEKFGTKMVMQKAIKLYRDKEYFVVNSLSGEFRTKSIILAMGADTKWLGVKGEEKYIGRGVSSCAPCDAAFFRNKRVYVAGGGDSAMEEALVLTKFANEVTLVHRREAFRASKIMVDRVMNHPKIRVFWDSELVEIKGEQVLGSVIIKTLAKRYKLDGKFMLDRGQGKQIAKEDGGVLWESNIDGVFVAIGHTPNSDMVRELVEVDDKGYILQSSQIKDKQNSLPTMTSLEGVFVAGDINDHEYKQAVTAAASGCAAAIECEKWLESMQ